jgi:hypothetical protein
MVPIQLPAPDTRLFSALSRLPAHSNVVWIDAVCRLVTALMRWIHADFAAALSPQILPADRLACRAALTAWLAAPR